MVSISHVHTGTTPDIDILVSTPGARRKVHGVAAVTKTRSVKRPWNAKDPKDQDLTNYTSCMITMKTNNACQAEEARHLSKEVVTPSFSPCRKLKAAYRQLMWRSLSRLLNQ
jgi:hypothetical protein